MVTVFISRKILKWQMNHLDDTYLSILNNACVLQELIYLNGNDTLKCTSSCVEMEEDCSHTRY